MIRIEVEEYCHNCLDFSPDITKPERVITALYGESWTDTIVRCEYRKRCASIKRYLEQQAKNEQEAVG